MKSILLALFPIAVCALALQDDSQKHTSSSSTKKTSSTSTKATSTSTSTKATSTSTSSKTTSTSTTSTKTTSTCATSMAATQSFYVNYNFETVGNGDVDPVALEPIDEYDLLYFNLIDLVDDTLAELNISTLTGGTPPNSAVFGPTILADPTALANSPAQITTQYTESIIQSFNPYSWNYACLLTTLESEASVPIACDITAFGYNSAGSLVATQVFPFVPASLLTSPYAFAKFNSAFQGLQFMNLTVTNNITTVAVFDNFIAELFQNASAVFYPQSAPIPSQ